MPWRRLRPVGRVRGVVRGKQGKPNLEKVFSKFFSLGCIDGMAVRRASWAKRRTVTMSTTGLSARWRQVTGVSVIYLLCIPDGWISWCVSLHFTTPKPKWVPMKKRDPVGQDDERPRGPQVGVAVIGGNRIFDIGCNLLTQIHASPFRATQRLVRVV